MTIKLKVFLTLSVILTVCTFLTIFSSCQRIPQPDNRNRDDGGTVTTTNNPPRDDRDDTSSRRGSSCEGDDDCEEQCEHLFGKGKDNDDCLELSTSEVEGMYDAFNDGDDGPDGILKEPDEDDGNLNKVGYEDVKNLLEIDDDYWQNKLIKHYSRSEAKDVMLWLADSQEIIRAITETLSDSETRNFIKQLLEKSTSSGGIIAALLTELGEDSEEEDVFLALAESEDLIEVTHEVLIENCIREADESSGHPYSYTDSHTPNGVIPNTEYREAACTLGEVYCKKDDNDNYIFEGKFEEIIDTVDSALKEYIEEAPYNSSSAYRKSGLNFDDNNDLDRDEISDVCETFCGKWNGHSSLEIVPDTCKCEGGTSSHNRTKNCF